MEQTPDREVESHLRQGAGREWLEEAAEDEQLTELLRRRRLDLSGRVLELVHRGGRVRAVEVNGRTIRTRAVLSNANLNAKSVTEVVQIEVIAIFFFFAIVIRLINQFSLA